MKIDLIVLDFDGTLFDTKHDIAASVNYALRECGLPAVSAELIWKYTGDGTPTLLKRVLGKENENCFDRALSLSLEYYSKHPADFTQPVDDVEHFLRLSKDKLKVVLSNKYKSLIDKILSKFGFEKYFDATFGKDSFPVSKPDPYPLLQIMRKFNRDSRSTIYIGDSINDIKIAKNAGVKCFIIPSGVSNEEDILNMQPELIFKSYRQLDNIIE
ncbi:MAG: HAD family hydrolase [Caldisericaceae bacterium]